ncbi:MAG: M20 family metallopeptidase [Ruminococcaceae bacterium]|nr:M20 family metallopeptidase [Oscillospiraceae bacterium]
MKIVNKTYLNQIDNYIKENKTAILDDLMSLVRIPSVKGEALPGAPFGEGNKQMIHQTAALFERNGFKSEIEKDGYYTLSYLENSGKTIGIFSHGDVVPADGEWLVCPPFEPIIKGDYMFGRGCNDDKSGVIGALYAAKMIKELNLPFKSQLVMYTGTNEEAGMDDILKFVENEQMPDLSLVPDADFPFYYGERSILRFFVTSEKSFEAIKDFNGGNAENIVLGEVNAKIQYSPALFNDIQKICNENNTITAHNDGDTIFVCAKGISAHTGAVDKGINAAKLLADALLTCQNLPQNDKDILIDVSKFICDGHGKGFGINHIDKNFGSLICSNGIARTENGKMKLSFDIRAGLELEIEDIKRNVFSACSNTWKAEFSRCSKGYVMDINSSIAKSITETYEFVSGIKGKQPHLISGGTYARELKNAYPIGTINHEIEEPIDLPKGHGNYHGPDEKLSITGFLDAIKIFTCILLEIDAILNK